MARYYLELFSGFGGWALGAYWAGQRFHGHWFSEIDRYPVELYRLRFPDAVGLGDIRNIRGEDLPDGDWYVSGSFPCTSISVAGKREGIRVGNESGLWFEYARIIRELRPRFALVENVGNITGAGLDIVLSDLSEARYSCVWFDIWASDVGAPHKRDRVWIVAYPDEFRRDWGSVIAGVSGKAFSWRGQEGIGGGSTNGLEGSGAESGVMAGGFPVSHSYGARSQGLQDGSFCNPFEGSVVKSGFGGAWVLASRVFPVAHGIPKALGKRGLSRDEIESQGYATHARKQLKGFGNAILPQIAELLWRAVAAAEEGFGK
jgi:DNA (cytosine-5)-methyltransferase 1